ncbi:hypothetical protein CHGG_02379 [Chaetomium globosum CBS 148.51]|uniref:BTB domain-containing protein n=1 Tax=Chaetomium globosum (strain ATCC 6205 / CBS 148.51 / DSM 1962 / NBRC 6347 / NRRL 1970) TaxID=306901 RepID=Q2HBM5_CHAGB|nr:uncharacterized protein CHGG_02379 [Chaetomium globosum CBS 148.51]EAQ90444.1 hypothetical protein CHGG_02379 [Chaetomium globosum CBS 148.51]
MFWHPNLAGILKELLEKGVFYSEYSAKELFPELFGSAQSEKNTEIASQIESTMFGCTVQASLNGDDEHSKELMESLKGLYTSGRYSDLAITCQGKSYRVHKAIVCPRSGFFAAACNGQFKASRCEASEGRIDLPDDDPEAVDAMISYFYRLNYDLNWVDSSREDEDGAAETATFEEAPANSSLASRTRPELVAHAKVYILSEKYLVGGLKALALQKFATSVCNHLDVDDFLPAIQEVYNFTSENDRGLRDVITEDLSQVDDRKFDNYSSAYRYCLDHHDHPDDHYGTVDEPDPSPDEEEFEPGGHAGEITLEDWQETGEDTRRADV